MDREKRPTRRTEGVVMKLTDLIKLYKKGQGYTESKFDFLGDNPVAKHLGTKSWTVDEVNGYNQCLSEIETIEIELDEEKITDLIVSLSYNPMHNYVIDDNHCRELAKALSSNSNLSKILRVKEVDK